MGKNIHNPFRLKYLQTNLQKEFYTNLLSLCGCSVSPGFEFVDFELGKEEELIATFPAYEAVIREFARDTHFESDAARRDGFVGTLTHPAAGGSAQGHMFRVPSIE